MPPREGYFILNPAADRGRAAGLLDRLPAAMREAGFGGEVVSTRGRGHAVELAEQAAESGWPAVIAVGGDGIVHEVANGLMRAAGEGPTVPLGVLGVGSGNDFVKMLGTPVRDPLRTLRHLAAAPVRQVDIGVISRWTVREGRETPIYFTNGIGTGFDAQVALEASRIRKLRGRAIYALALARALRRLAAAPVRLTLDGAVVADRPLALATISNGARHGGAFWLTPGAQIDDGRLDVLIADRRSPLGVLALLPRVLTGRHLRESDVELLRGRTVELRSEEPLPIHADGEIIGSGVTELAAAVLPGRLSVLA